VVTVTTKLTGEPKLTAVWSAVSATEVLAADSLTWTVFEAAPYVTTPVEPEGVKEVTMDWAVPVWGGVNVILTAPLMTTPDPNTTGGVDDVDIVTVPEGGGLLEPEEEPLATLEDIPEVAWEATTTFTETEPAGEPEGDDTMLVVIDEGIAASTTEVTAPILTDEW
jgi:hypothetical protein